MAAALLGSYIRRYFSSLNVLSGTILRILVIEKPDDWDNVRRYWASHLSPGELDVCRVLGWLNSTPYDRSRAYEIARQLGVRDDQLPCLALVDTPGLQDRIVFPILEVTPQYFRDLFATIKEAVGDVGVKQRIAERRYFRETLFDREGELARSAENYRTILEKVRAAARRPTAGGTYNFYGRTLFINHPSGDMSVSSAAIEAPDISEDRQENE